MSMGKTAGDIVKLPCVANITHRYGKRFKYGYLVLDQRSRIHDPVGWHMPGKVY